MSEENTNAHVPGGGFIVARKIFNSKIWLKPPLYLKIWVWVLGRASYSDHEKHGRHYKRGEFFTTYDGIIKAASYYSNRQHIFPSLKKIRIILEWLKSEGMIIVQPLRGTERPTGADPRARTRAYIGIKIIVVNYAIYQDSENYKGRHRGRPSVQQGHDNNKGYNKGYKNPEKISGDISRLKDRYFDQSLIDQAFAAIASIRKSNRVADSVLLAQLQKWEKYPVEQVEAGIRIFLDKDYAAQGKREEYLLAIIRNQKVGEPKRQSSGSKLLDEYYATNGN